MRYEVNYDYAVTIEICTREQSMLESACIFSSRHAVEYLDGLVEFLGEGDPQSLFKD